MQESLSVFYQVETPCAPAWTSITVGVRLRQTASPIWEQLAVTILDRLAGDLPLGLVLVEIDADKNWYEDAIPDEARGQVATGPEPGKPHFVRVAGYLPPGEQRQQFLRELWRDWATDMQLLYLALLGADDSPGDFLRTALTATMTPPKWLGLLHPEGDGAVIEIDVPAATQPLERVHKVCRERGVPFVPVPGPEWPR